MSENVHLYGHGHAMVSMRPLELGVHDFQADHDLTCNRLLTEGRKAIQEDGAEVLILGCGLLSPLLTEAGLTDVDGAAIAEPNHASLKLTEILVDLHKAGLPFISRKTTYMDVPSEYIAGVLATRNK